MNERQQIGMEQVFPLVNAPLRPTERAALLATAGTVRVAAAEGDGEMILTARRGHQQLYWGFADLDAMRRAFPPMFEQVRTHFDPDVTDAITMDLVALQNRDWMDPIFTDAGFERFAEWMEMTNPGLDADAVPAFPDGVTMRRAQDDDIDRLYDIWKAAYGDLADGDQVFDALTEEAAWAGVLETDGAIVAFAMTGAVDNARGEVLAACVAPEAWGNGYGRLVLAAATYQLAAKGATSATIKVRPDITGALRTCSDLGFRYTRAGIEFRRPVDEAEIARRLEAKRIAGVKARFGGWR